MFYRNNHLIIYHALLVLIGLAGLKHIFEVYHQLQLEARLDDAIMTLKYQVEGEDRRKK